jgi:hypothetical protein
MMSSRNYIARKEKLMSDKSSKDQLPVLVGGNATGDYKLKPVLIYHSGNLTTLKN